MKQGDTNQQSKPVVLYDEQGNPVQVDPEHIKSSQPVKQQNQGGGYLDRAQQAFEKQVHTESHVTSAPQSMSGYNFDPQIRTQYANEPGVVHATRSLDPQPFEISDDVQKLHEESVKKFPAVNLSDGEFVIHDVYRHPIGLLAPVGISVTVILVVLALLFSYPFVVEEGSDFPVSYGVLTLIGAGLIVLMAIFGYIGAWVYLKNRLILTNESVIQEIQHSLFSKHEQTVSLGSVEDASYQQRGIIQAIFNYGSIRLSTEGEETTYRFYFVENPKEQTAILINAVEAFKNGRPVTKDLFNKIKANR